MNEIKNKLVLALDVDEQTEAIKLVEKLKDYVGVFKIGKQLFTRYGPSIVEKIMKEGGDVFLDLKFHDIPNTVAMASREAVRLGVRMFNVHTCGGSEMLKAAVNAVNDASKEFKVKRPILLGVTVLTSISEDIMKKEICSKKSLKNMVKHYAKLAETSGLDGVVASPKEIKLIRQNTNDKFVILTPGIRPLWSQTNDQKRTMSPKEAIKEGASYIVIGRPITAATDCVKAAKLIIEEMRG